MLSPWHMYTHKHTYHTHAHMVIKTIREMNKRKISTIYPCHLLSGLGVNPFLPDNTQENTQRSLSSLNSPTRYLYPQIRHIAAIQGVQEDEWRREDH